MPVIGSFLRRVDDLRFFSGSAGWKEGMSRLRGEVGGEVMRMTGME
jgi:hypothetical protein